MVGKDDTKAIGSGARAGLDDEPLLKGGRDTPDGHFKKDNMDGGADAQHGASDTVGNATVVKTANVRQEISALLKLVWPVALSTLLQMLTSLVLVMFVGHYMDTIALDVVGLGVSFGNVFGISIGNGLASASDTLSSQAWGSNRKMALGVILQRGMWILGLAALVTSCLWINAEPILLALHQDPHVSKLTGQFIMYSLPALPLELLLTLLQRYLTAQNVVRPIFYVGLVANVCNLGFCGLFIVKAQMGIAGAALTLVMNNVVNTGGLCAYIYFSGVHKESWPGWTKAALLEWRSYLRLAIFGVLMTCIEWWSFEICQFLAGLMGEVQLASQLIVLNLGAFAFMIPLGISIAAAVRVGNLLGSNQPHHARRAATIALCMVACTSTLTAVLMLSMRNILPRAFTSDDDVVSATSLVLVIVSIFTVFDHTQGVYSGILRGCGMQMFGAIFNVIGYYVIGAPIMVVTAFVLDLEVRGLWLGLISAVVVQVVGCTIQVFCRTDWEEQARLARERTLDDDGVGDGGGGGTVGKEVVRADRGNTSGSGDSSSDNMELQDMQTRAHADEEQRDEGDGGEDGNQDVAMFLDDDTTQKQLLLPQEASSPSFSIKKRKTSSSTAASTMPATADTSPRTGTSSSTASTQAAHLPAHVKRSRVLWISGTVLLFLLSIVLRASQPHTVVCYPLPEVSNATSVCGRMSSLLAGHSCTPNCEQGFVSEGRFQCAANGTLVAFARCVLGPDEATAPT